MSAKPKEQTEWSPCILKLKCCHQVGYFTCGMKSPSEALVGDTFHARDRPVESLGEVQAPKPMVFAGFYPQGLQGVWYNVVSS